MPPRPKSLYRRALAGRLLYRTGSSATYCLGDGSPWHCQVNDDDPPGLAKFDKSSPCRCFPERLKEACHAPHP